MRLTAIVSTRLAIVVACVIALFASAAIHGQQRDAKRPTAPESMLVPDDALAVSPIEFDPGEPGGSTRTVELRKGGSAKVGDTEVDFQGFDLNADGSAMQQMQTGGAVTIGAVLRVRRGGREEQARPLYRFHPDGNVESPPLALADGGSVLLTGINASDGAVRLQLAGLGGDDPGVPARLSVDVTRKPLIRLVWYGLYLVLAGGLAAAANRLRQVRALERLPADSSR